MKSHVRSTYTLDNYVCRKRYIEVEGKTNQQFTTVELTEEQLLALGILVTKELDGKGHIVKIQLNQL